MKSKLIKAIEKLKRGKVLGIDDITAEILKYIGKDIKYIIFEIIEKMYQNDQIPKDFAKNKTIQIPKKGNLTVCNNYRIKNLRIKNTSF